MFRLIISDYLKYKKVGGTILIITCSSVFIDAIENFTLLGVPVTISCQNSSKAYL